MITVSNGILLLLCTTLTFAVTCPKSQKYTTGPKAGCTKPTDPLNKPKSAIESWFTNETFYVSNSIVH